jgi:hypothetical protein
MSVVGSPVCSKCRFVRADALYSRLLRYLVQKSAEVRISVSIRVFGCSCTAFCSFTLCLLGHAVAQWLRYCATNRKVAGSITDGVIGIFYLHKPSGRTMALGLIQTLTEMSTRDISWGKGGRCVGLTTLPPSCADCLEIWEPQPPGTLRVCPGL